MQKNLFGENVIDGRDYARKIITEASKRNHNAYVDLLELTSNGVKLKVVDENNEHINISIPGFYAIYQHEDCLYAGVSELEIWDRVYRFVKEVANKSRFDECHSGGIKARRADREPYNLRVWYLPMSELPKINGIKNFRLRDVDKYIATNLNALYNSEKW